MGMSVCVCVSTTCSCFRSVAQSQRKKDLGDLAGSLWARERSGKGSDKQLERSGEGFGACKNEN